MDSRRRRRFKWRLKIRIQNQKPTSFHQCLQGKVQHSTSPPLSTWSEKKARPSTSCPMCSTSRRRKRTWRRWSATTHSAGSRRILSGGTAEISLTRARITFILSLTRRADRNRRVGNRAAPACLVVWMRNRLQWTKATYLTSFRICKCHQNHQAFVPSVIRKWAIQTWWNIHKAFPTLILNTLRSYWGSWKSKILNNWDN